jgi:hypothetical protein
MTGKRKDLLNMLCDLSDLSALVSGSENIENFSSVPWFWFPGTWEHRCAPSTCTTKRPTNWFSKPLSDLIRNRWAGCAWAPVRDWSER